MSAIRVLIADDHPLIVEGLGITLSRYGVQVAGVAASATEVIERYAAVQPEVLVLDLRFGEESTSGLDILQPLLQRFPGARVVIYSQFDQDAIVREAYQAGARAFVTKNSDPALLAEAILQAHQGKMYFLPEIAERLALISVRGDESPLAKLQPREVEVFKLMAEGLTNTEIAERLGLSPKTISTTSQSIKELLGAHRPADITRLAVKYGLIQP